MRWKFAFHETEPGHPGTRVLLRILACMRAGPAFDCEILCDATPPPPRNRGKYCPGGASRDFSPGRFDRQKKGSSSRELAPRSQAHNRRRYLHECAIRMIYARLRPRKYGRARDKIFSPARLSARNSCQQRRAATPLESSSGMEGRKKAGQVGKPIGERSRKLNPSFSRRSKNQRQEVGRHFYALVSPQSCVPPICKPTLQKKRHPRKRSRRSPIDERNCACDRVTRVPNEGIVRRMRENNFDFTS